MYRGDGDGGCVTGRGRADRRRLAGFTAIIPAGDFSGDGNPDILAVTPTARC